MGVALKVDPKCYELNNANQTSRLVVCEVDLGANVWINGDATTAMITTSEAIVTAKPAEERKRVLYYLPTFIKID